MTSGERFNSKGPCETGHCVQTKIVQEELLCCLRATPAAFTPVWVPAFHTLAVAATLPA